MNTTRKDIGAPRLQNLSYCEFEGQEREWSVNGLTLGPVNLIVGKNASGKTRLLNVIAGLGTLLAGKNQRAFDSGTWDANFIRSSTTPQPNLKYRITYSNKHIEEESVVRGKQTLLRRSANGEGRIFAEQLGERMRFKVAHDQVAASGRRDLIQHSFLEELHQWGASVRHYLFGSDLGRTNLVVIVEGVELPGPKLTDVEAPSGLFHSMYKQFGDAFKRQLAEDFSSVGYPCSDLGVIAYEGVTVGSGPPPVGLFVKEETLPCVTRQTDMSAGMFRALAILIQINASVFRKSAPMVLIDDIGEGLDFERSKNLIGLLIRKAEQHGLQLVLTTNDRFIMNAVPLDYWSVLNRNGGAVQVLNKKNAKDRFDRFKQLGLNNFDFFTGQYFLEPDAENSNLR